MIKEIIALRRRVREKRPLIHCITNPISIHDCANAVLATGAVPIMAEHPREVAEITAAASALCLNLGNITDARMESMKRALETACALGIPSVLDLVGISCSSLRLSYAQELIRKTPPTILKGNMSELRTLSGIVSHSIGIDAGPEDGLNGDTASDRILDAFRAFSAETGALLLASGPEDLIVTPQQAYLGTNGTETLSRITGTGCMLGVLTASYLSCAAPLTAAAGAVSLLGVAGEQADNGCGTGTFQVRLMDQLSTLSDQTLEGAAALTPITSHSSYGRH